MFQLENFWVGTILIPLLIVLLKSEITNIYKSWTVFHARAFDKDRDPNTPDSCQILNGATGQWGEILIERYSFSWDKNKRGVFVLHPVDNKLGLNKEWAAERIPLLVWADMRKRELPKPLPLEMEEALAKKLS